MTVQLQPMPNVNSALLTRESPALGGSTGARQSDPCFLKWEANYC